MEECMGAYLHHGRSVLRRSSSSNTNICILSCANRACRHGCYGGINSLRHICVGKLTTIGSDNGLSPRRRQAILRTIARILLIGPLGTNFSEILIGIQTFSFKKMHLKMSSAKWRPSCLGLNVLNEERHCTRVIVVHCVWLAKLCICSNSKFSLVAWLTVLESNYIFLNEVIICRQQEV